MEIGFVRTVSQCLLTLFDDKKPVCTMSTHIDDLQPAARQAMLDSVRKKLEKIYGPLKVATGEFVHVGLEVKQFPDFHIEVRQKAYTHALELIEIAPARRRQTDTSLEPAELEVLMQRVGALSWISQNTRPDLAEQVSELQSAQSKGTVATLSECNTTIKVAKDYADEVVLKYVRLAEPLRLEVPADSAFKSKEEPGLPRWGAAVRIASDAHEQLGGPGNLMTWKSQRTKRAVRSTLGAETISQVNAYDLGSHVRHLLVGSMQRKPSTLPLIDETWLDKGIPMDLITDCQSLWGTKQGHKMPLEANLLPDLTILRRAQEAGTIRRNIWVNTLDMVADGLTKSLEDMNPLRLLAAGSWQIAGDYTVAPQLATLVQEVGYWVLDVAAFVATPRVCRAALLAAWLVRRTKAHGTEVVIWTDAPSPALLHTEIDGFWHHMLALLILAFAFYGFVEMLRCWCCAVDAYGEPDRRWFRCRRRHSGSYVGECRRKGIPVFCPERDEVREVAVQAQTTYRLALAQPRFVPLPEYAHGAWPEGHKVPMKGSVAVTKGVWRRHAPKPIDPLYQRVVALDSRSRDVDAFLSDADTGPHDC